MDTTTTTTTSYRCYDDCGSDDDDSLSLSHSRSCGCHHRHFQRSNHYFHHKQFIPPIIIFIVVSVMLSLSLFLSSQSPAIKIVSAFVTHQYYHPFQRSFFPNNNNNNNNNNKKKNNKVNGIIGTSNVRNYLYGVNDDDDDDNNNDHYYNYDEENEDNLPPRLNNFDMDDADMQSITITEAQSMTVSQLKQQLRLRGKKVSGTKSQLIQRLISGVGEEDNAMERSRSNCSSSSSSSSSSSQSYMEKEMLLPEGYSKYDKSAATRRRTINDITDENDTSHNPVKRKTIQRNDSKTILEAKAKGANIIDVTEFIKEEEIENPYRSSSSYRNSDFSADQQSSVHSAKGKEARSDASTTNAATDADDDTNPSSSTEVWGEDARIVEDYEGRSVVVDGLSRNIIEYKGCGDAIVQAYVVASRDSLRNFLRGNGVQGGSSSTTSTSSSSNKNNKASTYYSSMEEEVYAIQRKREMESRRGLIRPDEVEGQEDDTDAGKYYNTIERDYGDWGVYTPTGAQLSSTEVQGVLLLSDVYGPFTDYTRALADKIAFECQPVVVLTPDLFRGRPWSEDTEVDGNDMQKRKHGKTFEEWRATHPERRVDVDIRAAAAVLREKYMVSSIAVWGTCYGGGRALEAAAGWYTGGPSSYYEDAFSGRPPPPHVDPVAAVAWYPTRYDVRKLFGKTNEGFRTFESGRDRSVAIMAVFAENDILPGATPKDAMLLKECLEEDERVKDFMVKVFPGQDHGFAHVNIGVSASNIVNKDSNDSIQDGIDLFIDDSYGSSAEPLDIGGDAEVACLLSTAWMETYTRVFLPTVGTPVKFGADEQWSRLDMDSNTKTENGRRDVRNELEEAIANFEDVNVDLKRMTQSASPLLDGPGSAEYEKIEEEREWLRQQILEKYNISDEDDDETFERKFNQAKEDGALNQLLLDAYMDGDAYW